MTALILRPAPGHYGQHAVWAPDGALHLTVALSAVPARSPYQAGDWIRMHGYPGYPAGPRRWGFRGYVLGDRGNTLLHGLTDDGLDWSEHWGHLTRDGERENNSFSCACCPPPQRRRNAQATPAQLSLFDLTGLVTA